MLRHTFFYAARVQVKARAKEVFHSVDTDGGGTLDISELRECFKRMGRPPIALNVETCANVWMSQAVG